MCNDCFPKIRIPVCPFCRAKYGNNNNKYYNEIDHEFFDIEFDIDIVYYSDDNESYNTSRTNRRRRRRRHHNLRPRPRQITPQTPVNIFIIDNPIEDTNNEPEIHSNTKPKRTFKRNEKRRNNVNNSWNFRNLQSNISQSY